MIAIAWKAQQRLHHVWRQLDSKRGKRRTIVAVAVARQLAAFCWAIVTHDRELPSVPSSAGIPAGGRPLTQTTPNPRSRKTTAANSSMTTSQPHDTRLRRRRNPPGHHAREHPRSNYEQPLHAVTLDLESGLSRRNTVLRYQPANMSLTARRAPARPAAPSAEPQTRDHPNPSRAA